MLVRSQCLCAGVIALAFTVSAFAAAAGPLSVTNCGADPSGLRDSTAAFAKCLNQLEAGDLIVPYGKYRIAGTIVKNRNQNLIGMGSKASLLECQSTHSACLVAADTTGGPNNYAVSSIRNLGIEGPGKDKPGIGVYLGGDPNGRISAKGAFGDSVNLVDVRVTGFNHGVEWGNNAYLNTIVRSLLFDNETAVYAPSGLSNSGESISITNSVVFNNSQYGIDDHANFEWMIQGSSFDYNHVAVRFYGSTIHAANCHFEQNDAQVFFQPSGSAGLSIRDTEIIIQAAAGDEKYILGTWPQSLNLSVDDVSIWSNHLVRFFMKAQGSITGDVINLHGNGNGKIRAFADGETQLYVPRGLPFP